MTVKWNMDGVKFSNAKSKEDNYLVWTKTNMAKGEKIKINVKYNKDAFGYLSEYKQSKNFSNSSSSYNSVTFFIVMIIIIVVIISLFGGGGGYYGHRGFYGGYHHHRGYYGRAGCSKKDFYGTKINKNKLKRVLINKNNK